MSLVTLIPRASFIEAVDVERLRPCFEAIGAGDEFHDARTIEFRGNDVAVSWNDAGGAMLSSYGAHVLMRSRWVRGLAPDEARFAQRERYGVFRGRLGQVDGDGVALLAIRAKDPARLTSAELAEAERALRDSLTLADGGCRCPFCTKYSFSEAEADALAAGAKKWKLADVLRIFHTLVPTEQLVDAFLSSRAKILDSRGPEVITHLARVAPERVITVTTRSLESGLLIPRAARLWLRAHRTLGRAPDPATVAKLRAGPSSVATAAATELDEWRR